MLLLNEMSVQSNIFSASLSNLHTTRGSRMVYVDIWDVLIQRGHQNAAYGLLCDAFNWLQISIVSRFAGNTDKAHASEHAGLREELMEILRDPDGRMLHEWIELHATNQERFLDRASAWVAKCCDG